MYSVISPKESEYNEIEQWLLSYKKVSYDLIIKEHGKDGDHPHLNIIWTDVDQRTDDFTRKLKTAMTRAKVQYTKSPNLIRSKKITNVVQLIGGYLQKEDNYEVLYNSGKYDLDKMKIQPLRRKNKWSGIISFSNAPLDIVEYCELNNIDYLNEVGDCEHHSNNLKYLLGRISFTERLQVHHLLKKLEELHLGVLFLLGRYKKKEIYFLG